MTLLEYSKTKYHLENLKDYVKRAKDSFNVEDISVNFLYQCMEKRLENEKDVKKEYNDLIKNLFKNSNNIFLKNSGFRIFKDNKSFNSYIKKNRKKNIEIIEDISVFLTDKGKIYVPEDELDVIEKPYIYLGKYNVIWGYNDR